MKIRTLLFTIGCMFVIGACAPSQESFTGTLPKHTTLDMAGTFTFKANGELHLSLAKPCTVTTHNSVTRESEDVPCGRNLLDGLQVMAHTPWNKNISGTWNDAAHLAFQVDWKHTGLDPLADDAAAVLMRPWLVSGTQWTPATSDAEAMLKLISDATESESESETVRDGPEPKLEITTVEVDGGALHAGEPSNLVVRITNRGPEVAYRVIVTTRSSIDALHDQRLSFGTIKPGADKVRELQLTIPADETEHDAMIVLVITEGDGFVAGNVSRRLSILPSTAAPKLAMRCIPVSHDVRHLELDAGENLAVRCDVDNTGNAGSKVVELEVSIAGSATVRSPTQPIAVAGHATYDVSVSIPRDLPINSPVEITITAHDRQYSRTASTKLTGVIRKPRLCKPGQLTRAQYRAKLTELRAAVAAGDVTQAQLDRYDAELVLCLK